MYYQIMTSLKPLQWNSNIVEQFEFKLKVQKTFYSIPIRFCNRFLTVVKVTHHMEIDKIESFLNVYLIFSSNEFSACDSSDLELLFPNFIMFWE